MGVSGSKARIRLDDKVAEEFDWALIPVNPLDPKSDMKWGWKSLGRHYEEAALKLADFVKQYGLWSDGACG